MTPITTFAIVIVAAVIVGALRGSANYPGATQARTPAAPRRIRTGLSRLSQARRDTSALALEAYRKGCAVLATFCI